MFSDKKRFPYFLRSFSIIILIFLVGQTEEREGCMEQQHMLPFLSSSFFLLAS